MSQWIPQNPLGMHATCHVPDSTSGRFDGSQCTDISCQEHVMEAHRLLVEGMVEGGWVGWGGGEKGGGHREERAGTSWLGEEEDVQGWTA